MLKIENAELYGQILNDMQTILSDNTKSLSSRLDELEWRNQLLNELVAD